MLLDVLVVMAGVEVMVELPGTGYKVPGGFADGDEFLRSLSCAGALYALGSSAKKVGGP